VQAAPNLADNYDSQARRPGADGAAHFLIAGIPRVAVRQPAPRAEAGSRRSGARWNLRDRRCCAASLVGARRRDRRRDRLGGMPGTSSRLRPQATPRNFGEVLRHGARVLAGRDRRLAKSRPRPRRRTYQFSWDKLRTIDPNTRAHSLYLQAFAELGSSAVLALGMVSPAVDRARGLAGRAAQRELYAALFGVSSPSRSPSGYDWFWQMA
jgi:hypothetical protein